MIVLSFVLSMLAAVSYVHHGWNPGVFLFGGWSVVFLVGAALDRYVLR